MARFITFQTPGLDGDGNVFLQDKQGRVIHLYVGNYQRKLVMQGYRDFECLTDYASGQILVNAGDLGVLRRSYPEHSTDRKLAAFALSEVVKKYGAAKVLEIMQREPVINHD